jgi:hypothetical protein
VLYLSNDDPKNAVDLGPPKATGSATTRGRAIQLTIFGAQWRLENERCCINATS